MARVDFFIERPSGRVYINEINTIPGFTSISMFPRMWAHAGLGFSQLVEMLIDLALERYKLRAGLRFEK
jgi:D-alanine-D-alanine ligase